VKKIIKISPVLLALGLVIQSACAAQTGEATAKAQQIMQREQSGDPAGAFDLGVLYMTGTEGVTADKTKALQLWEKSAAAGFGPAMFNLGGVYAEGDGVEPDLNKGLTYLQNAQKAYQDPANAYPQKDIVLAEITKRIQLINNAMNGGQGQGASQTPEQGQATQQ
jgi:TPR repeat protein